MKIRDRQHLLDVVSARLNTDCARMFEDLLEQGVEPDVAAEQVDQFFELASEQNRAAVNQVWGQIWPSEAVH